MGFFKRKFEKILKELSFHCICILLLFIHEGFDKKEKRYCLKSIQFLSSTNIWVWKCIKSRGNKICSLRPMQSSTFDRIFTGVIYKTSSQNDVYIN